MGIYENIKFADKIPHKVKLLVKVEKNWKWSEKIEGDFETWKEAIHHVEFHYEFDHLKHVDDIVYKISGNEIISITFFDILRLERI